MSENKKLELLDQYDDITFALLMDEYAEEEGARLRKEFEEAQAAGEVSDTSDALDEKCLQMIHRDFAKKRGKENVRKIIRMTSKVAVAVMVFLGVATATVFSVDAFRIPVLNLIVQHFEEYSSFNNGDNQELVVVTDPLSQLLSEDYTQMFHRVSTEGYISSTYGSSDGNVIEFSTYANGSSGIIDSENAKYNEINLVGTTVQLYENEDYRALWPSTDGNTLYSVRASGLDRTEFLQLCTDLISTYEND